MTYRKTKPIRSLFFQFLEGTEFEGIIEPPEAGALLEAAGLIELIANKYDSTFFTHYRETEAMRKLPKEGFADAVRSVLLEGITKQ